MSETKRQTEFEEPKMTGVVRMRCLDCKIEITKATAKWNNGFCDTCLPKHVTKATHFENGYLIVDCKHPFPRQLPDGNLVCMDCGKINPLGVTPGKREK